jgi:hypothetical protein
MMDCRAFMESLGRARGGEPLPVELRDHAGSCRSCGLELRSRRLLGLGSHLSVEAPHAGFSGRLRARLQTDHRPADWYDAIGLVARPAFGLAAAVALLTVGIYSTVPSNAGPDDLALLAERDPISRLLLSGSPIELLAPPERAQR